MPENEHIRLRNSSYIFSLYLSQVLSKYKDQAQQLVIKSLTTEMPKILSLAISQIRDLIIAEEEKPFSVDFGSDDEKRVFDNLVAVSIQDIQRTSLFFDIFFFFLVILFDNFVTLSENELTMNHEIALEAFNAIQYYMKLVLQTVFSYNQTMEAIEMGG